MAKRSESNPFYGVDQASLSKLKELSCEMGLKESLEYLKFAFQLLSGSSESRFNLV